MHERLVTLAYLQSSPADISVFVVFKKTRDFKTAKELAKWKRVDTHTNVIGAEGDKQYEDRLRE